MAYGWRGYDNTPRWGYMIFYLVVLVGGLLGNAAAFMVIKKNKQLRLTIHFFFQTMCIVDILVCLTVIPFVMDSQLKPDEWRIDEMVCKMYVCLDYGLKGVSAATILVTAYFAFFWFRKAESISGNSNPSRVHKWGIPLAVVIGIGVSVPAGTLATLKQGDCSTWNLQPTYMLSNPGAYIQGNYDKLYGTNYSMNLGFLVASFVVPAVLVLLPLVALLMQVCGGSEPRLAAPHSRTVWTLILYIILFIALRAPHDVFELMKMLTQITASRNDMHGGINPQYRTPESEMILDCLVYLPCLLHPLILFILNPDYRQGFANVWKNVCNSGGGGAENRPRPSRQQPARPIIKPQQKIYGRTRADKSLVAEVQPMIVPAQRPLLNQMGQKLQGYPVYNPRTPYIPMDTVTTRDPLLAANNSFDLDTSNQAALPAEFEYGKFKYVDTARVEPKIAYTPTNTPPKTPQMPHFDKAPFKQPNYIDGTWILPEDVEAYRGLMPASQIPLDGYPQTHLNPSSTGPVEVDDLGPEPMEIESLENSPGNTLRTARRGKPEVATLTASPGARRRQASAAAAAGRELAHTTNGLNGHKDDMEDSRPNSPFERPSSRNTVEITLTGRTRSRQDLCPDRPRSKFEHAV